MTSNEIQKPDRRAFHRVHGELGDGWWVTLSRRDVEVFAQPDVVRAAREAQADLLAPPARTTTVDRAWIGTDQSDVGSFGCASDRGPHWIHTDKENEDFAFALELRDARDEVWVIAGVCDGVSHSPWSERGARHAAAAFIELVRQELTRTGDLAAEVQAVSRKQALADEYSRLVLARFDTDGRRLQDSRCIDPKFSAAVFKHQYLDSREAADRKEWFQTTILCAALGPRGGFLLSMGDGYLRVDRRFADGSVRPKQLPLPGNRFITTRLANADVRHGIWDIPPEDAVEISVTVATDEGVSKSPDHGLDAKQFADAADCSAYLAALASRDEKCVESDNMSVAFASRRVSA